MNRKRILNRGKGLLFAWYLVWYGLGRMVIEGLRTDSLMLGSLRVSQGLSVVLVLAAGLFMVWRMNGRRGVLVLPLLAVAAAVVSLLGLWPGALYVMYAFLFAFGVCLFIPFNQRETP